MVAKKKECVEFVKVDTTQPGALEMIDIIDRYNSTAVVRTTPRYGRGRLVIKLKKAASPKIKSGKKIEDFSIGEYCGSAVTIK